MNKSQFITELEHALKRVPKNERMDMINDYQEHFANGMEEGKSEDEISHALGSPQKIAKELLAMYHLGNAESNTTTGNVFRAAWAGLGIGFFNLVIVLGPFIAVVGIVAAGWITGIAFIVSPILALINNVIFSQTMGWFQFFFALFTCGIGIYILIGVLALTKMIMNGFMRYLKFNASLVKGGLK